jgi:YD repeat-containing protein
MKKPSPSMTITLAVHMPGSACSSQNSPPGNGYFTTYSYDPLGNLTSVSQNGQNGQSRQYHYDGLSRLTAEFNPETSQSGAGGWTSHTYDSINDGKCAVTNPGDQVERVDPAGNYSQAF